MSGCGEALRSEVRANLADLLPAARVDDALAVVEIVYLYANARARWGDGLRNDYRTQREDMHVHFQHVERLALELRDALSRTSPAKIGDDWRDLIPTLERLGDDARTEIGEWPTKRGRPRIEWRDALIAGLHRVVPAEVSRQSDQFVRLVDVLLTALEDDGAPRTVRGERADGTRADKIRRAIKEALRAKAAMPPALQSMIADLRQGQK